MGSGNYGGQGGGMPAYQQMSSYPQGQSGKGGASPYGPPPQRMESPSPYGGGKGGGRSVMQSQRPLSPEGPQQGPSGKGVSLTDSLQKMRLNQDQVGPMGFPQVQRDLNQGAPQPMNPFEGNAEYKALMDYQKSLGPTEEQQTRLRELQSAFEGSGAYKDYRIQQLENQQRMAEEAARRMSQMYQQRSPYEMGGIGGFRGEYGPPIQRDFGGFRPFPQQYAPKQMYSDMYNDMYNRMYKKGGMVSR